MTDYTNAPPPHGALFDDAPTRRTSDDYAPAVAVWPSGKTQRCNVKRAMLLTPDAARAALVERGTVVVYVAAGDAEAVTGGKTTV